MNIKDAEFKDLLTKYKDITVYGLSPKPNRPSQEIPLFMNSKGYKILGIYPGEKKIAGFRIYPTLAEVPKEYRKFVNVFQRSEKIPDVVDEVIEAGGVEVLWLQLGISHSEAEKKAEKAGIKVVSDRCLLIEYKKYMES